jgi:hypothetical protein
MGRRHPLRHPALHIVFGTMTGAILVASANAAPPPHKGCREASKIEYDSARKTHLLQNRFGMYVRTGRVWRRSYWYCIY